MSRSAQQIQDSLSSTVLANDPSADLAQGPIFDFLLAPVPPELAQTELQVEQLGQLVSLQFPTVATATQINAVGTSFGISQLQGKNSTTRQTFFTFTKPINDIIIPRGILVGTADQSLVFVVDEQVTLSAAQQAVFFNASRRRWEITARIVATASSPNFDLPATRINLLMSTLAGIDGTINLSPSSGGLLQQSNADYFRRVQLKFQGLNPEAGGGIVSSIFEFDPNNVTDVSLVYPKDRGLFFRDISTPGIDAYVIGTVATSTSQTFVSPAGGETVIPLDNVPVLTVDSVLKNNIAITDFAFLEDLSLQTRFSARATDAVVLTAPLAANDTVTINYTYNQLISDLQAKNFNNSTTQFDTDILARMPVEVPIVIDVDVYVLPSFDPARVTDSVQFIIFNYCQSVVFVDDRLPEVLAQNIRNQVAGVSNVILNKFTTSSSSVLDVQVIQITKNQIPTVDQNQLVIRVRQ